MSKTGVIPWLFLLASSIAASPTGNCRPNLAGGVFLEENLSYVENHGLKAWGYEVDRNDTTAHGFMSGWDSMEDKVAAFMCHGMSPVRSLVPLLQVAGESAYDYLLQFSQSDEALPYGPASPGAAVSQSAYYLAAWACPGTVDTLLKINNPRAQRAALNSLARMDLPTDALDRLRVSLPDLIERKSGYILMLALIINRHGGEQKEALRQKLEQTLKDDEARDYLEKISPSAVFDRVLNDKERATLEAMNSHLQKKLDRKSGRMKPKE